MRTGWYCIPPVVNPSTLLFTDGSILFDSSVYPDSVGHSLAVGVEGGWWNNFGITQVTVETNSSEGNLIEFDTTDPGVTKSLDYWGGEQSWISSSNMTSTIENLGHEQTDSVRINFPATAPLEYDGGIPSLPDSMSSVIDSAMQQVIRMPDAHLTLMLVNKTDLHDWYVDTDGLIHPVRWVDAVIATIHYVNDTYGYMMDDWDFVEVFNEPDWDWPVGSMSNMAEVMAEYRTRSELDTIPLLGPSTLSCSTAQNWYNATKTDTDIAGCHVINGSMADFNSFINNVHADGKPFINPEIHNFVETMIQAEYSDRPGEGGLFWGGVNPSEGRFAKACQGQRIAYKADAATWSAASAYRDLQGRIWLFAGSNERHAFPSLWEFQCADRDVFFDGQGPLRSMHIAMDQHSSNHVEVTWGDRNPLYVQQYVDIVGNQTRMAVSGGAILTVSNNPAGNEARWEFRPAGAFYTVDNVGAEDAGQDCRLGVDAVTNAVLLVPSSQG